MWEQRCIDVHQITYDDERIQSAEGIERVWQQFTSWFYREVNTSKTVILVTWNGETCDLKWLWKITQAPGSRCSLPQQIKFFIDPFRVVGYFKTCPINKTKSKIESYYVGSVWKFISNANLNGAHDSLIDAKAQTNIFIHKYFGPFIDRKHTVEQIDAIFTVYVVVCFLAKGGVGKKEWRRYDDKNQGRHDFQIDLGIALMNYGISTEWKDTTEARPNFIRQTASYRLVWKKIDKVLPVVGCEVVRVWDLRACIFSQVKKVGFEAPKPIFGTRQKISVLIF